MEESCILQQFAQIADLSHDEKILLMELEKDPRVYEQDTHLNANGRSSNCFFTLRRGWACAERELADGQRQVLDIFLPGQVMGLRELSFQRPITEFLALTEVEACPFPRERLKTVIDQSPRLARLFFLILAREQSMLVERIISIGRRPAANRLAHFILELKIRLNEPGNRFCLPLSQAVIGDALGLSAVHVSRTLKQLRADGLVVMDNGSACIEDLDGLIEFAEFNRAYLQPVDDWVSQG